MPDPNTPDHARSADQLCCDELSVAGMRCGGFVVYADGFGFFAGTLDEYLTFIRRSIKLPPAPVKPRKAVEPVKWDFSKFRTPSGWAADGARASGLSLDDDGA